MTRRKKKPKKTTVVNKNDKLFSELVRSRGKCEAQGHDVPCSGIDTLQCAHIKSRRYKALRWDLKNAYSLCAAHHYYYHANPDDYGRFIGEERSKYLNKKMAENKSYRVEDYLEIQEILLNELSP